VHFIPLHRHPFYKREFSLDISRFPNAEDAYSRCISLPIYPDLTDAEVQRVITVVTSTISEAREKRMVAV
jgi:perosamine synthetase